MEAAANILSFVFLALGAVAYARRDRPVLAGAAVLFFPVTAAAVFLTWAPVSPTAAALLAALTLGIPLLSLLLFAIDVIWAPFCLELTYLTFLCWLLCPLAVLLNFALLGARATGAL